MLFIGSVAHLGERIVRNDEAASSILVGSTNKINIVVGQTRLFGFAQNDLSNIDEASM